MDVTPQAYAPQTAWRPEAGLTDHAGRPIAADWEFFVAPPPEIGAIRSAHTTLRTDMQPRSIGTRLGYLLLSLLGGVALSFVLRRVLSPDREFAPDLLVAIVMVAALLVGVAIFVRTRFRHCCTFVGEQGLLRAVLSDSRESQPKIETFLFRDAADLRTSQTRQYVNGIYQGTDYIYAWTDANGGKRFRLSGRYRGEKSPPKPDDPFHFAVAGEMAWSVNQLAAVQAQLERQGYVQFSVNAKDCVRLAPGKIEFHFRGRTETMTPDDIKAFNIAGGTFSVRHKDARWFGSAGKFDFQYGNLANAQLFLLVLEKLVGLRF